MSQTLGQKVQSFGLNHVAQQVGSGECFDLADQALRSAGAKSAADYGEIIADADYQWGSSVQLVSVVPGDILQFRDFEVTRDVTVTTRKTLRDGSTDETTQTSTTVYGRPHHTAIVSAKLSGGKLRILEQNAPPIGSSTAERVVRSREIDTVGSTSTTSAVRQDPDGVATIETTTTLTVTGTIWAYHPQAR